MTTDILQDLNQKQREAVENINGPLLINAGPGSGKTRVITHRIAYLIRICNINPYQIAAVTFTNKAAREMRDRLNNLLNSGEQSVTVSTFHSFCAMLLRRESHHIGIDSDFSIYDDSDQIALIKLAMKELNIDPKKIPVRSIQSSISSAKSQLISLEGFGLSRKNNFDELVYQVYEKYERDLLKNSALDFDDLLLKTHFLLSKFPDVSENYQNRYVQLMIDEFQDTNVAQYAIAKHLSSKHRNLCVVGDPDQAIYSWRNADIRNILSFQSDYHDAKIITLDENYRSSKTILEAAQSLIVLNEQRVGKTLWTNNQRGVPIIIGESYNEKEEAQAVVKEIDRLIRENGYSKNDIAVMFRVNAQSRALEEACLLYGIPYQLIGSIRFYQRQEIKDLTHYLRLISNSNDDISFARMANIPPRGIGKRTMDELSKLTLVTNTSMYDTLRKIRQDNKLDIVPENPFTKRAYTSLTNFQQLIESLISESENMNILELIDLVLERSGYKKYIQEESDRGNERWENILEYRDTTRDFLDLPGKEALTSFLESVSLVSDIDNLGEDTNAITLITLHQAKGLEFKVVFMVGMEDGMLPHIRSLDNPSEMEEERRLCYVGVTRAKERLYLHRAFRRGFRGNSEPSMPSRFLTDIPQNLTTNLSSLKVNQIPNQANRLPEKTKNETSTEIPFSVGDKIRHTKFGEGIVTSTKEVTDDLELTIAFTQGAGIKRLLLSFAPIEKIQ
jgi:DNA helicase-2/ATP-dependent DNA helicase PcrA